MFLLLLSEKKYLATVDTYPMLLRSHLLWHHYDWVLYTLLLLNLLHRFEINHFLCNDQLATECRVFGVNNTAEFHKLCHWLWQNFPQKNGGREYDHYVHVFDNCVTCHDYRSALITWLKYRISRLTLISGTSTSVAYSFPDQGVPWSWKVMEFLRRPFSRPGKSWKIMQVTESHGKWW